MYQIWGNMELWALSGLNLCCWVHVCGQIVQLTSSGLKRRHPEYQFRFILLTDVFPQSKTDLRLVNCLNVFLPGGKREGRQVNKQRLFENYFASQLSFSLQIFFFSLHRSTMAGSICREKKPHRAWGTNETTTMQQSDSDWGNCSVVVSERLLIASRCAGGKSMGVRRRLHLWNVEAELQAYTPTCRDRENEWNKSAGQQRRTRRP